MEAPAGKTSHPSDLNEAEWAIPAPSIPRARKPGRPEKHPKRTILNAIFYLVRRGGAWRMLPSDLPPWKLVGYYFPHWKKQGVWARLSDALRDAVRLQAGKKPPRLRSATRARSANFAPKRSRLVLPGLGEFTTDSDFGGIEDKERQKEIRDLHETLRGGDLETVEIAMGLFPGSEFFLTRFPPRQSETKFVR